MYKAIYCKPILESLSLLLKMKNSNPEDSLFLSCGLKTSFLALFKALSFSALNTAKKDMFAGDN